MGMGVGVEEEARRAGRVVGVGAREVRLVLGRALAGVEAEAGGISMLYLAVGGEWSQIEWCLQ